MENSDASLDELLWAYGPSLLGQHAERLHGSGIWPEIASARGYRSVQNRSELGRLGFSDLQCRVPALLIPIRSVTGAIVLYQARPDEPRIVHGQPRSPIRISASSARRLKQYPDRNYCPAH